MQWSVIAVPEGRNLGTNQGGLIVYLTSGDRDDDVEVARVAFDRSASEHPDVEFFDALMSVLGRADQAADIVNALMADYEKGRAAALKKARAELRELSKAATTSSLQ